MVCVQVVCMYVYYVHSYFHTFVYMPATEYYVLLDVCSTFPCSPCSLCARFGHQDPITGIDCLARERPISSGGCDKSVRSWKIVEESQLVYLGHQ